MSIEALIITSKMASSKLVAQIIRDLLVCGICLEQFDKPRALPCLHAFCEECLVNYCKGKKQVLCPTCKRPAPVPSDGACGFPAHFMVNTLLDTIDKVRNKKKLHTRSTLFVCNYRVCRKFVPPPFPEKLL